jgi:hypothetical protein
MELETSDPSPDKYVNASAAASLLLTGASTLGNEICSTFASVVGPSGSSAPNVSIKRIRNFFPRHEAKSRLETVTPRTRKKPAEVSVLVGAECHSSLSAAKTVGSHATACCEP